MASLYADENFPAQVVEALRTLGHDVLTALEAGQGNQRIPDDAVLRFATQARRAVLTLNRWQFIKLHGRFPRHAGILVCSSDADGDRQAREIDRALRGASTLDGILIRINRPA